MADKSPWGCFIPAALILGLFGLVSVAIADEEKEKARARSHPAPAVVAIEDFDPSRHKSDYEEVRVRAQLDISTMERVIDEDAISDEERRTTVVRLYAPEAKDRNAPAPGVLVTYKALSANRIVDMAEKMGPLGPIVVVNGLARTGGGIRDKAAKAVDRGPLVSEKAVYVEPFLHGRMEGLAAENDDGTVMFAGLVIASPFLLIGLYRLYRRRQRRIAESEWNHT